MKVLYIITKSNWGGAQRHVFDVATEAKKEGFDVAVALGGTGILKQKLENAGIRTISINSLGRDVNMTKDAGSFFGIWKIIRNEKPDVVHLHSPKAGGLGAFASRLSNVKKIIYTAHGWAWNENRPARQKTMIAFFSWLTMLFSTNIITLSKKETDQALKFPFVSKKIVKIPLGISPVHYLSHKDALAFVENHLSTVYGKTISLADRHVTGTISELHVNKGLSYLIEGIKIVKTKFPDIATVIISPGELEKELKSLVDRNGLNDNVYFAGFLDQASLYLKAFSVFTLTSLKEGLPYTIFESAYADVPVIATAVGGIPELIEDMKSGILIQSKKPAEIASSIEFIFENKATAREYAHTLHDRMKTEFSIANMFERTFALYK